MCKQVGKEGVVKCPGCGLESRSSNYDKIKENEVFDFRCLICGKSFRLK